MHFLQISLLAVASSPFVSAWGGFPQLKHAERQVSTQSLIDALANYTDLSSFQQILKSAPGLINANVQRGATVLVPTNEALSAYMKQNNATELSQLHIQKLTSVFQYHTLDAALTSANFSASRGLTVPTKLTDSLNNLRRPGPALISQFGAEATGQVLYISKSTEAGTSKFRVRQAASTDEKAGLQAGLGQTAELTGVDGVWDGGYFQIVNTVLEMPTVCSATIKKLSDTLSGLDSALRKVSLWQELDKTPNVTCLGPNTAAFNSAGNPEKNLNQTALTDALLFHTLPQVAYSNFLTDGQEFMSLGNVTVRVTVKDNQIWFNDAKVVQPNVLTNNGLIHVLDRVMSAEGKPDTSSSPSSTSGSSPSSTSSPSPTGTPPNSGNTLAGNIHAAGVIAFAAVILLI
ncbi:fasciclin domain-containing protein [Colletotrichum karsti]|uniref:Fasciclin domain-containing protein n=1 Tax=Colletotrichum karsti TaxID=1095194 RepID=A0A9P6IER2_9PEZI|nr:fasciclin domain-containing protein [Colletotrichum karsti]KAF9882027.1 fasciclin domain-containing protein [Colletotrichum karsti]